MSLLHAIRCNKFVLEIQDVVKVESVLVSACGGAYPGKLMINSERTRVYQSESGNCTMALADDTMLTRNLTPFKEEHFLKLREVLRGQSAVLASRKPRPLRHESHRPE